MTSEFIKPTSFLRDEDEENLGGEEESRELNDDTELDDDKMDSSFANNDLDEEEE